ncbi:MAG: GWxTD domain-containing protein [Marinilabiliaceae bacterium]|jgi:GWxTD domain-containing protein|nr:GWxTD domain-containing protein [Marinilabiliaceae bacterium]
MPDRDKILLIILGFLLVFSSCTPVQRDNFDPDDMSYLYNPLRNSIHPRYRVYNDNDQTSTLSVKLYANELYFSEANPEGVPIASLVFFYRLYNISQGRVPVDTALTKIDVRKVNGKRDYIYSFSLKAPMGYKYEVELLLKDAIRSKSVQAHIPFDKTNYLNKHSYKVRGHFNKYDVYTEVLKEGEYFNVLYPAATPDTIYLKYYKPYDRIPVPPSMLIPEPELDFTPYRSVALPYSDTLPIMLPNRGVYTFSVDSNTIQGCTLFNFGNTYPGLNMPDVMIEPLIYLSNPDEIEEMLATDKHKIALDNFWLEITGNVERSRELVRIYYNRVLYANYFFSSYKEGWRTDRGMIYIIYGPPDKVYKTNEGEKWGYRKPEIKSSWSIRYRVKDEYLFFSFSRRDNPFTDNDFTLLRSESVTTYWDQAIRSWRNGIVFRLDNPQDL